ncbi:hypothetical protein EVAR_40851_1 [Eumeta japonica]|uniref:Uncharacterized protein n=1 Tax=Eumeta variegata TaxID=151549 RepID=A0A4C1X4B0_EUMVA|nr:hypothetical protein EVAR_40851_1 [Eumeta japonica]
MLTTREFNAAHEHSQPQRNRQCISGLWGRKRISDRGRNGLVNIKWFDGERNGSPKVSDCEADIDSTIIVESLRGSSTSNTDFTFKWDEKMPNTRTNNNAPGVVSDAPASLSTAVLPFQRASVFRKPSLLVKGRYNAVPARKDDLARLLQEYQDIFTQGGGPTPFAEHRIDTGDHSPIAVPPYRLTPAKKAIMEVELDKMLCENVIEE